MKERELLYTSIHSALKTSNSLNLGSLKLNMLSNQLKKIMQVVYYFKTF